jgi:hypothetical protein
LTAFDAGVQRGMAMARKDRQQLATKTAAITLRCHMESDCTAKVTYIDNKGYIYCTAHGAMRRFIRPCRKLTVSETRRLESGQIIKY